MDLRNCFIVLCCLGFSATANAQSLPYNPLFDDTRLNSVYIIMQPDSLDDMYAHDANGHEYIATFLFDDGVTIDTVEDIGIRFRGNTSLMAAKKSFKISFNTYNEGREYHNVKKLNLCGSHNDPSMVREKFYFDVYNEFGLPVRRTSFIKLFINDVYFGLYTNLEEMDEIFLMDRFGENTGNLYKCTYPADLTWHGTLQSSYGQYDLQTNEQQNNYGDLIHFIDVLNNTPDENFQCEIEKVFDVENFLKIYALDISAGHWDNYGLNMNNFFLYHNQFTGRFMFLSYDCDNTFGVDWTGIDWTDRNIYNWQSDNRPLVDRLLGITEYRDKLSYYLSLLAETVLIPEYTNPILDNYLDLIDEAAFDDVFRTYDYGYTYDDFLNSFDTDEIDSHTPYGIKNFLEFRNESTLEQLELNNIIPVAKDISHVPLMPDTDDEIAIRIECFDDESIGHVQFIYSTELLPETVLELFDDGAHNDLLATDGIFGGTIPGIAEAGGIRYHFDITDNSLHVLRFPYCEELSITVGYVPPPLVINEFMAKNVSVISDEADEYEDYVEIFNASPLPVYLGDKFLSDEQDNPFKWRLPDVTLSDSAYLLIWADDEWEQGIYHAAFKLDGDKDEVYLFDAANTFFSLIDSVSFISQNNDISAGRLPNGAGPFVTLEQPSPGYNNELNVFPPGTLLKDQIVILSNPSYDHLTFQLQISSPSVINIDLFDLNGQLIMPVENKSFDTGAYIYTIPTGNLANGLYYLRAIFSGVQKTYRVVIY